MSQEIAHDSTSETATPPEVSEGSSSQPGQEEPHDAKKTPTKEEEPSQDGEKQGIGESGKEVPPPSAKDCLDLTEEVLEFLKKLGPMEKVMARQLASKMHSVRWMAEGLKTDLEKTIDGEADDAGDEGDKSSGESDRGGSLKGESDDDDGTASTTSSRSSSSRSFISLRPTGGTFFPRPRLLPHTPSGMRSPRWKNTHTASSCRVHRATMEEWKSKTSFVPTHHRISDRAIVQAFYHRLHTTPVTSLSAKDPDCDTYQIQASVQPHSDLRNLQRILIFSTPIQLELEKLLSGAQFTGIIALAPPFKLLVRFLPQLRERLVEVEKELEEERKQSRTSPDAGSADAGESATEDKGGEENAEKENVKEKDDNTGGTKDVEKESRGSVQHDAKVKDGKSVKPAGGKKKKKKKHYGDGEKKDSDAMNESRRGSVVRIPSARESELDTLFSHLKLLVDFMNEEFREIVELRAKIAAGTLEEILFEDLWHLFQPGDLILDSRGPNQQLLRVCAITGGQIQLRNHTREESEHLDRLRQQTKHPRYPREAGLEDILREEASGLGLWTPLTIDCFVMGYDGKEIGPLDNCRRIKHYAGKRAIQDLDVYPLKFHPNSEELLKRMEERGRRILNSYGHKRYKGATINSTGTEKMDEVSSDVFIDMKTYYTSMPWQTPGIGPPPPPPPPGYSGMNRLDLGHLLKTKPNPTETSEQLSKVRVYLSGHEVDTKISEDFLGSNRLSLQPKKVSTTEIPPLHLQLLQYPVVGYAFRYRRWMFLDIDLVREIDVEREAEESGFKELVIPPRYRDLLVALVDSHISGRQGASQPTSEDEPTGNQIDLVKGKGQGVIILLHGPPGSGKTSTAETIAAYTKRPLYHLTFGDIGTTADMVERNLVAHARRANKWGCVLLLDEADVFLRQRDWNNMHHNALVSVFLRELEYYSGILFLTTNRPGVLDEAFKSRIHITLHYPNVNLYSTRTMWANILNRLDRDNKVNDVKVAFKHDELMDFAERHYRRYESDGATWNGRQIRNAFRTALAIGHHDRLRMLREEGVTPEEAARSGKKKWMRVRLTKGNFKKIAKTSYEFEEYISTLRGKDTVNVRNAEVRDDFSRALGEVMQQARKDYGSVQNTGKSVDGGQQAAGKGKSPLKAAPSPGKAGKAPKKAKVAPMRVVEEDDDDDDEDEERDEEDDEDQDEEDDDDDDDESSDDD